MSDEIVCTVKGGLGHIYLNRPQALNALTLVMCEIMNAQLVEWAEDPEIGAVLVSGAGERAFCAGGDVILLHDSGKAGDDRAEHFWRVEYALNELIHRYEKPYISLIDGFVMGGGVGLSVHGHYRVAGDKTVFAMPETGIGYFPDVGGSYFLPRLGMEIGQWLGLTGARLDAGMSCELGVATHFVPSVQHEALADALTQVDLATPHVSVQAILETFATASPATEPLDRAVHAFGLDSVPAILTALEAEDGPWAYAQLESIRRKSPLAVCVSFEALRRGAGLDFRSAMQCELDISLNFLITPDFYEGIRAQLIDKDRNPQWTHMHVGEVSEQQIERLFTPVANPPLGFLGD